MDITSLKKIGLSDKEIKIYLGLLEYGGISVRSLAELTGLNRGTTYDVLKRLRELGLASYYEQDTKQKFVAEDAEKLIKLASDREAEIKAAKDKISALIPELRSLEDKSGSRPTMKVYEGRRGIRTILEDLLSSFDGGGEYYVYSARKGSEDIKEAFPDFTEKRIVKKIGVKAISLAEGGKTHGLDERRWLGCNDESATFILIYRDRCAFISRDSKSDPIGAIIENKMIYETQKKIFLALWKFLNKNKNQKRSLKEEKNGG